MCGIAGSYSINNPNRSLLEQATETIRHRGPDACGFFGSDDQGIFLGHRRLSILDLSNGANQPMRSACGRYTAVYNGEIYNFKELKAKLSGHQWTTESDTEVVVELFAKYGPQMFAWLNGMFALAIFDKQKKQLTVSRDQTGIKPLFYYLNNGDFVFSSELKFIAAWARIAKLPLRPDPDAVPLFLHLGFIPEPKTVYQEIQKFPSGHYGVFDTAQKTLSLHRYWKAADHFRTSIIKDEQTAFETYKTTLFEAVGDQMISDVPLGTFLSGGIDSSLVTAVASRHSAHIKSFSIGFHEERYDESAYAEAVAKHLGTNHHSFKVSVGDVLELIPSLLDVYDEPYGDSSAFPTMLVSRLARKHVTVALSGDGGDELFQGYGMYTWAMRLNHPAMRALRHPLYALSQLGNNRIKRAGTLLNYTSPKRLHSHIFSQEQYFFSEKELKALLVRPLFNLKEINETGISETMGNPAERQALWDFNYYLKDDLLVKVDRASMRYSLETRVPLLDTRLVELAFNIDFHLKVRPGFGTKYLMKKVLYEMVPPGLFERPKRGFAIPLKEWLQGPLRYLVDRHLSEHAVADCGLVKPEAVATLLRRFREGEDYLYNRVWLLTVLHWWMGEHKSKTVES